jgi:hypothetical protein
MNAGMETLMRRLGALRVEHGSSLHFVFNGRCLTFDPSPPSHVPPYTVSAKAFVDGTEPGALWVCQGGPFADYYDFHKAAVELTSKYTARYYGDLYVFLRVRNAGRWLRREVYVAIGPVTAATGNYSPPHERSAVIRDPRCVALAEAVIDGRDDGLVLLDWLSENAPPYLARLADRVPRVDPRSRKPKQVDKP